MFANTDWYLYNFRLPLAKDLSGKGVEVVLVAPPGVYVEKIEAAGFRFIPVCMDRRSLNVFSAVMDIVRLSAIYKREKPDLVHHFTIKSVAFGSLAARLQGIAAIVNAVAGLGYVFSNKSIKARMLRPFVLGFLRFVLRGENTRLILQNPDDQALFLGKKIVRKDQTRLILGSGVDTDRFSPNPDRGSNESVMVVLATRLLWGKGIQEYADAARLLKSEGVKARFILAGAPDDGNPDAVSRVQLTAWSDEGVLEPVGHIEDMVALLSNADIVVLPSDYGEGVPRILIEAASCGLPLITTDIAGCREIVEDGVNGFLVPPRDAAALAAAMRRLMILPDRGRSMGAAGRSRVLKLFDERVVIDRTESVYSELIDTDLESRSRR